MWYCQKLVRNLITFDLLWNVPDLDGRVKWESLPYKCKEQRIKWEANHKILISIDHFQKKTSLVMSEKFISRFIFFYICLRRHHLHHCRYFCKRRETFTGISHSIHWIWNFYRWPTLISCWIFFPYLFETVETNREMGKKIILSKDLQTMEI